MFATGMKNKFDNRVYIELFAGPGRCRFPDAAEDLGSPLQMIDLEFTKFMGRNGVASKRLTFASSGNLNVGVASIAPIR